MMKDLLILVKKSAWSSRMGVKSKKICAEWCNFGLFSKEAVSDRNLKGENAIHESLGIDCLPSLSFWSRLEGCSLISDRTSDHLFHAQRLAI